MELYPFAIFFFKSQGRRQRDAQNGLPVLLVPLIRIVNNPNTLLNHRLNEFIRSIVASSATILHPKLTPLIFSSIFLGYRELLLDLLLQKILLLGQHLLGFPKFVKGLLGRGHPAGPMVFGSRRGTRAGVPFEKLRYFTHV